MCGKNFRSISIYEKMGTKLVGRVPSNFLPGTKLIIGRYIAGNEELMTQIMRNKFTIQKLLLKNILQEGL